MGCRARPRRVGPGDIRRYRRAVESTRLARVDQAEVGRCGWTKNARNADGARRGSNCRLGGVGQVAGAVGISARPRPGQRVECRTSVDVERWPQVRRTAVRGGVEALWQQRTEAGVWGVEASWWAGSAELASPWSNPTNPPTSWACWWVPNSPAERVPAPLLDGVSWVTAPNERARWLVWGARTAQGPRGKITLSGYAFWSPSEQQAFRSALQVTWER